jgi:hypothetical protein
MADTEDPTESGGMTLDQMQAQEAGARTAAALLDEIAAQHPEGPVADTEAEEEVEFTVEFAEAKREHVRTDYPGAIPHNGPPDFDGDRAGAALAEREEYDESGPEHWDTSTPSRGATDELPTDFDLEAWKEEARKQFYEELYAQNEPPRISQATEVNAELARVHEKCICGSEYKVQMPAEFRDDVLKGVNTWRRHHQCGVRS